MWGSRQRPVACAAEAGHKGLRTRSETSCVPSQEPKSLFTTQPSARSSPGCRCCLPAAAGAMASVQDGGFKHRAGRPHHHRPKACSASRSPGRARRSRAPIVVNVPERRLYLVEADVPRLRYGIGVGRSEGMNFRGSAVIGARKNGRMDADREHDGGNPVYRHIAGGMEVGPTIRSAARASISTATAMTRSSACTAPPSRRPSGRRSPRCIRLFNQDIIDLYNRVPVGARVTVVQG